MNPVLETKALTKCYGTHTALENLSIRLQPGRIYGLVGNNGAGKSTLCELLAGLLLPTAGSFSLLGAGTEVENRRSRRQVGFLLGDGALCREMTALQNLVALQKLRGYTHRPEALSLLSRVGLEGSKATRERLSTFSTGQRQRTALAAALLGQPKLLVLDEPLVGLDQEALAMARRLLTEERDRGAAVLISSHNLPQLFRLAEEFLVLHRGRLVGTVSGAALEDEAALEEYFRRLTGEAAQ